MAQFTADTPLGREVQSLLLVTPQGLPLYEIRRALRREKGMHVTDTNLQELLRSNPRLFTLHADGRYTLGLGTPSPKASGDSDLTAPPPDLWSEPFIVNLHRAQENFVIFDLEATGVDPQKDQIIQIAALRVEKGEPVAMGNWYVNPGQEISYTLQTVLGMDKDPAFLEGVQCAPPLKRALPEFIAFVGDLPLVAYNARFDGRLLASSQERLSETPESLTNPMVDALELALLLLPNQPRHRLADVAEALGLTTEELRSGWEALDVPANFDWLQFSSETFHNAVTDVYVLFRVYAALRQRLTETTSQIALLHSLLPEISSPDQSYQGFDQAAFHQLRTACQWRFPSGPRGQLSALPGAGEFLDRYFHAKGYAPRPGQHQMQRQIVEAIARDRFVMVEAPTGTGKTLAYLTAAVHEALASGRKVALSTAYRNLQDQLLAEIDDFRVKGPIDFQSQLLKGVGNYFCWTQILRYLEDGNPDKEDEARLLSCAERFVLVYCILWLPGSRYGSLDELSYWLLETLPVARAVVHQLQASAGCNPNFQDSCSTCPMPAAYENAQHADILVINHALWLSDPRRLPDFGALVLDEAHTLEDVATNALTQEVSSETLNDLLRHLYHPQTERGLLVRIQAQARTAETRSAVGGALASVRRMSQMVDEFGPALARFIRACTGRVDPRYGASYRLEAPPRKVHGPRFQGVDDAHRQIFGIYLKDLLDALSQVLRTIQEGPDFPYRTATIRELSDYFDKLAEQKQLAYSLLQVQESKLVYWLAVGPPVDPEAGESKAQPEWWAMRAAPIDVGAALTPFYDKLTSAAFVSATLALRGNDFSYFVERLGLKERLQNDDLLKLPPALPYDRNVFLGLTNYLTYAPLQSTMESFVEELSNELLLLLRFTDGRSLGLFTARQRMEEVAGRIASELGRYGIPLLVQSSGSSRQRLLESFREREESVLFGLRSFWEGVDAPGRTLSFVLMEKLPFPLLIEPVHRARAEQLVEAGRSEFEDYMLPLMLLQFKQGFGRLMRREDDRGAVILFDKRIHRKHYRADLLHSLPGFLPRDEESERSRRSFYEKLAELFPDLIDYERKRELLLALPEDILLDLEESLARLTLPVVLSAENYEELRPTILEALQTLFGHDSFRLLGEKPIQEQVVQAILSGRDVLGVLPTGAGKSLTFQLTALLRDGATLVFSPLIALMIDQVGGLHEKGIEIVGAIYSGQSASERDDVLERMRRGRTRLVYISPERLRDPQLLEALRATNIIQMVVDEAHCVYMWGPSFRPDFLHLPRLFDLIGKRPPIAALTATATPDMEGEIVRSLRMVDPIKIIAPVDRPNLHFAVYNAASQYGTIRSANDRFKQLLRILQAADHDRPSILIYVATTVEADQLARYLRVMGFDSRAYHGKMEPADRASVQDMFMDDHINIVVCTKAFGMGIDKPNIRYVIHYNLPGDLESYFQEAGRAGRDGETAYCILLYHPKDVGTQEYFIENSTPDEESINRVLSALAAVPVPVLYLDPVHQQERLGIDDVPLRVALHHLEMQGFLTRESDFTLSGSLTFQVASEEALDGWRADGEPDVGLLDRLLRAAHWPAYRKVEIELLPLAEKLNVAPDAIDQLLFRLSAQGHVVYRPWKRGMTLRKTGKMAQVQRISAGSLAAEQHRKQLKGKLERMIAYATGNRLCRRAAILSYFGQDAAVPCDGCDVCQPEREWPWSLVSARDYATPDAYFDPAFVVLETVKWNLDRSQRYGAPYGTGTLIAILKGDSYSIGSHESAPHMKRWRLEQARGCPAWGIFATLPSRDRVLDAILDQLRREAFIEDAAYAMSDGATYNYLNLTGKGIQQLTSGKLLQWGNTEG